MLSGKWDKISPLKTEKSLYSLQHNLPRILCNHLNGIIDPNHVSKGPLAVLMTINWDSGQIT